MEKCPIGFHPSELEKIAYLLRKMNGQPFPSDGFISLPTIDIYGDKEPWEICENYDDNETFYFFTVGNVRWGQSPDRIVCKGVWKMCEQPSFIHDSKVKMMGSLKKFRYRTSNRADQDAKWLLEEYTLAYKFNNLIEKDYAFYKFCSLTKTAGDDDDDDQDNRTRDFLNQMLAEIGLDPFFSRDYQRSPSFTDWL